MEARMFCARAVKEELIRDVKGKDVCEMGRCLYARQYPSL